MGDPEPEIEGKAREEAHQDRGLPYVSREDADDEDAQQRPVHQRADLVDRHEDRGSDVLDIEGERYGDYPPGNRQQLGQEKLLPRLQRSSAQAPDKVFHGGCRQGVEH